MVWTRPELPAISTVYYRFRAKDADSDQLVNYRVEDVTEDRYKDVFQHFLEYFIDDEPLSENRKDLRTESGMVRLEEFWMGCLAQKMSIVCYKEGSNEIVGANILYVKTADDVEEKSPAQNERDISATLGYMTDTFNLFENYGVDKYLSAYGLAINRRYRNRGIATEILKARVPLCKEFGFELTSTIFTAAASQQAAAKAGFKTDLEVTMEEFAKMGPRYTFPGIKTNSLKLMSLKIE